jgi:DNA-directed RNA polymerase omega subunit
VTPRPGAAAPEDSSSNLTTLARFHIAAIATQRARQLQQGARPRIEEASGHKPTRVAVMEVLANAISWEIA